MNRSFFTASQPRHTGCTTPPYARGKTARLTAGNPPPSWLTCSAHVLAWPRSFLLVFYYVYFGFCCNGLTGLTAVLALDTRQHRYEAKHRVFPHFAFDLPPLRRNVTLQYPSSRIYRPTSSHEQKARNAQPPRTAASHRTTHAPASFSFQFPVPPCFRILQIFFVSFPLSRRTYLHTRCAGTYSAQRHRFPSKLS